MRRKNVKLSDIIDIALEKYAIQRFIEDQIILDRLILIDDYSITSEELRKRLFG